MRRLSLLCCLFISLCAFSAEKGDTLRLMTYNLRFGELASMEQIGDYIASERPDIVALQECDWDTRRKRAVHQNGVKFINVLAGRTGLFGIYGKSIDYAGGYYGLGILSRYPIIRYERILLPNDGKTEQRSMLVADIELPVGQVVTFVNTHLEVKTEKMRMRQVEFINDYLKDRHFQLFLAGDMNALPESAEMALLRESWLDLTDRNFTYHSSSPEIKIDYIYAKPADKLRLLDTGVREQIMLSDHYPVVATILIHF